MRFYAFFTEKAEVAMKDFIVRMYKKYEKFIKFCVVGVLNTIVTYVVYYILVRFAGMEPSALPFKETPFWTWLLSFIVCANTIGDIAGGVNSYFWNSRWVFKNKSFRSVPKFILTFIVYMLISAALMFLCVRVIGMNKYVAKIIVIPITTVINFFMSKLFAFRKKKEKTEKTSEEAKERGSDGDLEEK